MSYQDEWVKGDALRRGYRECEQRYEIVKGVCASLRRRDFTVCDIGRQVPGVPPVVHLYAVGRPSVAVTMIASSPAVYVPVVGIAVV